LIAVSQLVESMTTQVTVELTNSDTVFSNGFE